MPTTKITVYRNNQPLQGAHVSLYFPVTLGQGGHTRKFITDIYGVAFVEHAATGRATVYVNGSPKGEIRAPGQDVVYI